MKPLKVNTILTDTKRKISYRIEEVMGRGATVITYRTLCIFPDGNRDARILKEYAPAHLSVERAADGTLLLGPDRKNDYLEGKKRFLKSGRKEQIFRRRISLTNETAPLLETFEANNTVYFSILPFRGTTLDHLPDTDPVASLKILRSVSRLVNRIHEEGFLCLDLKPENLFVLFDSEGNPVTELIHLIDFDSFRELDCRDLGEPLLFTTSWAAPELLDESRHFEIGRETDCYLLGELLFVLLFSRHSTPREHRLYAELPIHECRESFLGLLGNQNAQAFLKNLFSHTLRSHTKNRYSSASEFTEALTGLIDLFAREESIVTRLPYVTKQVYGRKSEEARLAEELKTASLLWIQGPAGIGKTTLVLDTLRQISSDPILYFSWKHSFCETIASDAYTAIDPLKQEEAETTEEYTERKLRHLSRLTKSETPFFVLDNVLCDLSFLNRLPKHWKVILLSRFQPPSGLVSVLNVKPPETADAQRQIFETGFGQALDATDRETFLHLRILLGENPFLLKLAGASMRASHLSFSDLVERIQASGLGSFLEPVCLGYGDDFTDRKPGALLEKLLEQETMDPRERGLLQTLCILPDLPLSYPWVQKLLGLSDFEVLNRLIRSGKVNEEKNLLSIHPLMRETLRSASFSKETDGFLENLLRELSKSLSHMDELYEKRLIPGSSALSSFALQIGSVLKTRDEWIRDPLFLSFCAELLLSFPPEQEEAFLKNSRALLENASLQGAALRLALRDRRVEILSRSGRFFEAKLELKEAYEGIRPYGSPSLYGRFYDTLSGFYDERLGGVYDLKNCTKEERKDYRAFLKSNQKALEHLGASSVDSDRRLYVDMLLSRINRMARSEGRKRKELEKLFLRAQRELKGLRPLPYLLAGHLEMTRFWYETYSLNAETAALFHLKKAEACYERVLSSPMDRIRILLIPKADALLTFGREAEAVKVLEEGIALCDEMGDCSVYLKCKCELTQYLLDCYLEADDGLRAKEVLAKLDALFPDYCIYGITNPVSEEQRLYILNMPD